MSRMTFRPATLEDALAVAANLRDADRAELAVSRPGEPLDKILAECFHDSRWCTAVDVDGAIALVYGVAPTPKLGIGAPWMLGTPRMHQADRDFIRACKPEVELMLASFSLLLNAVHRDNVVVLRWLKWLGFTVMDKHPLGRNGELLPFFKRAAGHV